MNYKEIHGANAPHIPDEVCKIDGHRVNIRSIDHALSCLHASLDAQCSFYMCTLNLDHVVKLRNAADFRQIYELAWFVTIDSMPLVWLKRATGIGISKAAGADMINPICRLIAERSLPVFLVGPDPLVNTQFLAKAQEKFGGFEQFHHIAPSASFDPYGKEADKIIMLIKASNARLCLVGLGAPKQEIFSFRASNLIDGVGFIPVGAAVEFMAGTKRRAPRWMQQFSLEWAWRLSQDPRRLSKRYFLSFLALTRLIYHEALLGNWLSNV